MVMHRPGRCHGSRWFAVAGSLVVSAAIAALAAEPSASSLPNVADPEPSQGPPHGSPTLLSSTQGEERREAVTGSSEVPIALDTVLRLAEEQNPQVAVARARVAEACAEADLARKRWLPDLYVGTGWYRHEGGIQLQEGPLINSSTGAMLTGLDIHGIVDPREVAYQRVMAQRRSWQQKGELKKITSEMLLDAAGTYIDLLTAVSGQAIARELQKDLEEILPQAVRRAETEPAAAVEAERVRAEIAGRRQNILRLQEQANAATAKLAYLLGVDPCSRLVPVDRELVPFDLVDVGQCTDDLVARALADGPGIQELSGLVRLVDEAVQRSRGPGRLLPAVEFRMIEGAFNAGQGSFLDTSNRWDLGVVFRWNLADLAVRNERQRIADAQRDQVHLAYQDLRAKLTAGVHEAREAIVFGKEQIAAGREQIKFAQEARRLSKQRIDTMIPGATITEVLLSLQTLSLAQIGHLQAIREYDKAELRLMLLLGCTAPEEGRLPQAADRKE
jgi:outer membrane protein TolC